MQLREVRVSESLKDYFDPQENLVAVAWGDFANDREMTASLPDVWDQDHRNQWTDKDGLQYFRNQALEDFGNA